MDAKTDAAQRRPHLAFAMATTFGVGYFPKAPGTFGSMFGLLLTALGWSVVNLVNNGMPVAPERVLVSASRGFLMVTGTLAILVSFLGLWAAGSVAAYLGKKDPQCVVIDEVAGQLISYLGLASGALFDLNWKYLLAGFILFRVFDIWKPFPARRAESLPGGLGIMADDLIAGLYAALALALARQLGF